MIGMRDRKVRLERKVGKVGRKVWREDYEGRVERKFGS